MFEVSVLWQPMKLIQNEIEFIQAEKDNAR